MSNPAAERKRATRETFSDFIHLSVAVRQAGSDMIEQIGCLTGMCRLSKESHQPWQMDDLRKAVAKAQKALENYDACVAAGIGECTGAEFDAASGRPEASGLKLRNANLQEQRDAHAAKEQSLAAALNSVRKELWVDYCIGMGRTDTDPRPFDSKPHIRIIDAALAKSGAA